MKISKYTTLLFVAIVIAATFAVNSYKNYQIERSELISELPDLAGLEEHNNQELRALLFRQELKKHPPFSLALSDLDLLKETDQKLEADRATFETLYEEENEKRTLRELMYPTEFLYKAIEVERARRSVIESPTDEATRNYFELLSEALEAYSEHIGNLKDFTAVSKQFPYGLIDGTIENHSLAAWFTKLEERVNEANTWQELQKQCLDHFNVNCVSVYTFETPVDSRLSVTSSYSELELNFADRFVFLESDYPATGGADEPLSEVPLVKYRGYCSEDSQAQFARVWWNKLGDDDLHYTRLLFVDDPLFFNHEANAILFSEFMINQGVPYQHQPVNHYMCNHYGQDLTSVTAAYGVWRYAKDKQPDSTDIPSLQKLRELETTLRNASSTISYSDVLLYLNEVTHVLNNDKENLSLTERNELEDLLLGFRDGSMYYEHRLASLLKLFEFTFANFKRVAVPNAEFVVLGFSAMPMTLMADNPTTIAAAGLPVQKYQLDAGYPHLFSGLDTLQNQNYKITDPLEYLNHTHAVIGRLKDQDI